MLTLLGAAADTALADRSNHVSFTVGAFSPVRAGANQPEAGLVFMGNRLTWGRGAFGWGVDTRLSTSGVAEGSYRGAELGRFQHLWGPVGRFDLGPFEGHARLAGGLAWEFFNDRTERDRPTANHLGTTFEAGAGLALPFAGSALGLEVNAAETLFLVGSNTDEVFDYLEVNALLSVRIHQG